MSRYVLCVVVRSWSEAPLLRYVKMHIWKFLPVCHSARATLKIHLVSDAAASHI